MIQYQQGNTTKQSILSCYLTDIFLHRNAKPLVAQLMRIHVVTPKAPIHVTLNPRVQPAPSPCPVFVTGCEQPLKLSQSAYWVLRLPYPFTLWSFQLVCQSHYFPSVISNSSVSGLSLTMTSNPAL